jgi:hypothetical protein
MDKLVWWGIEEQTEVKKLSRVNPGPEPNEVAKPTNFWKVEQIYLRIIWRRAPQMSRKREGAQKDDSLRSYLSRMAWKYVYQIISLIEL